MSAAFRQAQDPVTPPQEDEPDLDQWEADEIATLKRERAKLYRILAQHRAEVRLHQSRRPQDGQRGMAHWSHRDAQLEGVTWQLRSQLWDLQTELSYLDPATRPPPALPQRQTAAPPRAAAASGTDARATFEAAGMLLPDEGGSVWEAQGLPPLDGEEEDAAAHEMLLQALRKPMSPAELRDVEEVDYERGNRPHVSRLMPQGNLLTVPATRTMDALVNTYLSVSQVKESKVTGSDNTRAREAPISDSKAEAMLERSVQKPIRFIVAAGNGQTTIASMRKALAFSKVTVKVLRPIAGGLTVTSTSPGGAVLGARLALLGREKAAVSGTNLLDADVISLRDAHERLALQAFSFRKFRMDEVLRARQEEGEQLVAGFDWLMFFYVHDRRAAEIKIALLLSEMLRDQVESGKTAEWALTAYAAFWVYRMQSGAVILSPDHPLYSDQLIGKDAPEGERLRKLLQLKKVSGARDGSL